MPSVHDCSSMAVGRGQRRTPSVTSIRAQVQRALKILLSEGIASLWEDTKWEARWGFLFFRAFCLLSGEAPGSFLSVLKACCQSPRTLFEWPLLLGHQWVKHTNGAAESLAGEGRASSIGGFGCRQIPSAFRSTAVALPHFLFLETVFLCWRKVWICLHIYQKDWHLGMSFT